MKLPLVVAASLMCTVVSLAQFAPRPAPVAAQHPKDVTVHGDTRIDDYFWLREKDNPEVRAYLEAENAHTEAALAPAAALRDTLYQEMRARIKEDDVSAKTPFRGWFYYTRTEKDKQYPIYCRARAQSGDGEEVLLDLNVLGAGKPYIAIGDYRVSDDGERLVYSIDWTGYRQYEVFVMDLATKRAIPQAIGKVAEVEWGAGHDVLYYITENEAKRSDKLHRWNLVTSRHELLYTEPDELYNLVLFRTRDSRYVMCESQSKLTTETRVLRADDHTGHFRVLLPRTENHEYHADYRDGRFYLVTNKDAKNFRVVSAPEDHPDAWTDIIPARPDVKIDAVDLFATHMVVHEREDGLPQLAVYDFATRQSRRIAFPDEVYEVDVAQNWNYDATEYRYAYESLARPRSVYATDFATGERHLVKQTEVPGFNAANYVATRAWAVARDGTRIPLSVVHRRDLDRSQPQPLWLYGYGSYGISQPVSFSSARLSLLDRGFIFVIAHVRGGGELGEEWREAGRMERKVTTFTDFVDCGQWLVDQRWTTSAQMVTAGRSAGGLLMGAVINLRPDLFTAALVVVPFVDVLNTMLDASLPLTTEEYVEWGNPNLPAEYRWMRVYSPYDNLHRVAYPNLLVNVSFYDSQVPYWEGAKFLAKARTLNTGHSTLLLHTNFDAGHGGASGRFDALKDTARDYAFFLSALGRAKDSP